MEKELVHSEYPHQEGSLYDCEACEAECFCNTLGGSSQCVYCAITEERVLNDTRDKAIRGKQIYYYQAYDSIYDQKTQTHSWQYSDFPVENSMDYSEFKPYDSKDINPDKHFVEFPYASGSDYSGDSVNVSNFKVVKEHSKKKGLIGKTVFEVYGSYGTYALFVSLNCDDLEIWEMMNRLDDYPVLDEEEMSEVEMEAQNEAWENWARKDFQDAIYKAFRDEEEFTDEEGNQTETFEYDMDEVSDEKLHALFRALMEHSNTDWEIETGNNAYVDIARIVKVATPRLINAWLYCDNDSTGVDLNDYRQVALMLS